MSHRRCGGAAAGDRRRGLLGAAATAILSLLGAYLALELWRASIAVPFRYVQVDDTKFYFALVKGILENGWFQPNPSLAAPSGQTLHDFPQGADNLNFLLIKAIGLFSSNYALVTNLFFLLTFPLTALAAYCALRRLGRPPAIASVCSVLFALLPFHFYRHESQLLLSAYYAVPLGAYLFLGLFGEESLVARRDHGPRLLAWASWRTLVTLASCVVIGSTGLYYAVFTLLLLLAGTLVALLAGRGGRRSRSAIVAGVVAGATITATLTVNLAPSLLYAARHGGNPQILRSPLESEQLGLHLSNLVLPVLDHRLAALAHVNARYATQTSPRYCESCNATLGVVGSIGFVFLCLVGLAACASAAGPRSGLRHHLPYRPAALGVAIALALGSTGGISSLIAFFITPDVRAWNRISLFIAFFSLLAVGLLLEAGTRRLGGGGRRPAARRAPAAVLLAGVLVLGGLDETSHHFVVDYAGAAREYASDQDFGRVIEARLPPGASVLELPYVPFPEGYHLPGQPPLSAFSTTYELLRPYLSTRGLRWSFGAIKGRPSDWEGALAGQRLDVAVAGAAAAGFRAVYVDPRGYDSISAGQIRTGLTRLLGSPPAVSARQDAWLFDLGGYLRRLHQRVSATTLASMREATLRPMRALCGPTPAELILHNPTTAPRPATLGVSLNAPLADGVRLQISFPDGSSEWRNLTAAPVRLTRRLIVAPGPSRVTFSVIGPPPFEAAPATPAFVLAEATLTDLVFAPLRDAGPSSDLPIAGQAGPSCNALASLAPPHVPLAPPPPTAGRRVPAGF